MNIFKIFGNIFKIINIFNNKDQILDNKTCNKNYNYPINQNSEQGIGWNYGHV